MEIKGIDVSGWQENIDWAKVKADGIKFAILRCGWGQDVTKQDDSYFEKNVKGCEANGIPYGVYLYSYADTTEKAKSELAHLLRLLKGKKPSFPVYYDLEDAVTAKCSKAKILEFAKIVINGLEAAGYWAGIYANLNWFRNYLTDPWYDTKAKWIAQYASKCTYEKTYGMWQYSSSGKVKGISGNVDMNICYSDYPTYIKTNGLNGWKVADKKTTVKPLEKPSDILKKGDKGIAVYSMKQMLRLLKDKGEIKAGVDNDDIFGAGTEIALKEVQKLAGIGQDGKFGTKTADAMYKLLK